MTKKQTAYLIALEERNKALAEEVQALEKKQENARLRYEAMQNQLEDCSGFSTEQAIEIVGLKAELQQYKEPVLDQIRKARSDGLGGVRVSLMRGLNFDSMLESNKTYRILILEAKDA